MTKYLTGFLVVCLAGCSEQAEPDGIHGFTWGTSYSDVIRMLGEPTDEFDVEVWYHVSWNNTTEQTLANVSFTALDMAFDGHCEEDPQCKLWGGTYYFESHGADALVTLRDALFAKYGSVEATQSTREFNRGGSITLADPNAATPTVTYNSHLWKFASGAGLELYWIEHDIGYTAIEERFNAESGKFIQNEVEVGSGIQSIIVDYTSPELQTFHEEYPADDENFDL
jgi:hypothetical protein